MTTKTKPPAKPLRDQIVAYLAGRDQATLKQIAAATSERDFPSRVTTELNKLRTDALVECEKKKGKNELWYWLAAPAQATPRDNSQPAVEQNTGSSAADDDSAPPAAGAAVQPQPAPAAAASLSAAPAAADVKPRSTFNAGPPGWSLKETDDEKHGDTPRRKRAQVRLHDAPSFTDYVRRHGSLTDSTVWCEANYVEGKVAFVAIINDHGEEADQADWRDHTARYTPTFSEEWRRWVLKNKTTFGQAEFAQFIEDNLKDVASAEGLPTGAQMLEMALSFEANQDMRFKSAIRLQNGGVQMSFVQDDDSQTLAKMQLFDRFALGIPVFWNGDAYRIDARLRYRVRDGKLSFWFELIRQDKVLEAATTTLIEQIRTATGSPFFFGEPFV